MTDTPQAAATSTNDSVSRQRWRTAFNLAFASVAYGWCANLVFNRLLHWVTFDIGRTALWSLVYFASTGAALRMAGHGADYRSIPLAEVPGRISASIQRAMTTAIVGVTIILTLWSYGSYRQWI